MRLINVHSFKLHTFYGENIPSYAILSHTWLEDYKEVTFAQFNAPLSLVWRKLRGALKIEFLCQQAAEDGYTWAWIDTCCIDKTNNAELSEAINSMFQWYRKAKVCYVYLMDVDADRSGDIFASRWWSRAWTLQELVAPTDVLFYDAHWQLRGSKSELADDIANRKSIDIQTLCNSDTMYSKSVAQRMSWAAHRQATREEDLAYALLGIFNINMTMQYGEGEKAFVRLQKEIVRTTNDMSIFAWGFDPLPLENVFSGYAELGLHGQSDLSVINSSSNLGAMADHGIYASRPSEFSGTQDIVHLSQHVSDAGIEERYGVHILQTAMISSLRRERPGDTPWHRFSLALLPCTLPQSPHFLIGILFRRWQRGRDHSVRRAFARNVFSCLVRSDHVGKATLQSLKIDTSETIRGLGTPIEHTDMSHTLVVLQDTHTDIPFEMQTPTPWQSDVWNFNRFCTSNCSAEFLTTLRFHIKGARLAIYVGFLNKAVTSQDLKGSTSCEAVHCSVFAVPTSRPEVSVAEDLRRPYQDLHIRSPRGQCKEQCKHDKMYVKAVRDIVFNQALTTVTLVIRGPQTPKTDDPDESRAMCLKPEEWTGKSRGIQLVIPQMFSKHM